MAGMGNVALLIGTATAINGAYALQHQQNAVVPILGGAATGAVLVVIGSATGQWEIVEALAVVFLAGSLFKHHTVLGITSALQSTAVPGSATGQFGNNSSGVQTVTPGRKNVAF